MPRQHERPERLPELENLTASIGRARFFARAAALQDRFDTVLQEQHVTGKVLAAQGPSPHPMPKAKHAMRMSEQLVADPPGFAATLADFRKVSGQVRSANLTA